MSLLSMLQGQLTSALIGSVAGKLGESESVVSKALGGLIPTILAGMVGKAGTENGLNGLFGMLSKPENSGFLNDLGGLVGTGNIASGDPRDAAGNLIGSLFGDKVGGILGAIGSFAGLRNKDSAGGLLGLAGPLIMGVLGKEIVGKGLNAAGLKNLLLGEKDAIYSAVPAGIASLIGIPAVAHAAPPQSTHTTTATRSASASSVATAPAEEKGGMGFLMWALPAAAIGLLGYFTVCAGPKKPVDVAVEPPAVQEQPVVAAPAPVTEPAALTVDTIPGLDITTFGPGTVEGDLVNFINSGRAPCTEAECWFTLERVTFNTGSDVIDMAKSSDQLGNLVKIANAYPSLKLKFGGYTDNTGNEQKNIDLSNRRAQAIIAKLIELGIAADRMKGEGYGSQFPVADNSTEEGRAQNRRIDVRVDD